MAGADVAKRGIGLREMAGECGPPSTVLPSMTASDNSPHGGESVTTEQSDEQISHGEDWIKSEYSETEVPGPVVEMMSIPDHGAIEIEGHRATDTDERSVQMRISTSKEQPNASILQILKPEQAEKIGEQLIAAARVASGEEVDPVGGNKTVGRDEVEN